jgi:hypothetical protein
MPLDHTGWARGFAAAWTWVGLAAWLLVAAAAVRCAYARATEAMASTARS